MEVTKSLFADVLLSCGRKTRPVGRFFQLMALPHYPSDLPAHTSVIDFGCGNGEFFAMLGYSNVNGVGIEHRSVLHSDARNNGHYVAVYSDLNARVSCADVIVCNSVLEHVKALPDVLRSIKDYLKPNGRLFFSVPAANWERQLLGTILYGQEYGEAVNTRWQHDNLYEEDGWARLLEEAGLIMMRAQRYMSSLSYILADMLLRYPELCNTIIDDLYEAWRLDRELCRKDRMGGYSLFVEASHRSDV